jgi:hypothetical protein
MTELIELPPMMPAVFMTNGPEGHGKQIPKLAAKKRWFDSERDPLPKNAQHTLINVKGVYFMAVFQEEKQLFRAVDELLETVFRISDHHVFWLPAARI